MEILIPITPVPKPRMTRRDKFTKRTCVQKFWGFKEQFKWYWQKLSSEDFSQIECLNVVFLVEMPKSWSQKKRQEMALKPHKKRPDRDNYLKALQDVLSEDSNIWDGRTTKLWSEEGGVYIYSDTNQSMSELVEKIRFYEKNKII